MANVEKFTDESVMMLLKHSDRELTNDSNIEIDSDRSKLNYTVPLNLDGKTSKETYEKVVGESYLYGRGSAREKDAVTCCSWVITLPKEVSDYSINHDGKSYIHEEAERAFFQGCTDFVTERYGHVFYDRVHYDEGGQPHIHIYFVPVTELDHDRIHYKTVNTHQPVRTESGRYEFIYRFKTDENGEKIELKNYAKMSDYYDHKISAADVLNTHELRHFHEDLAEYLRKNDIPGAEGVYTGTTGGKNISVKAMKEFTRTTGLTLDDVRQMQLEQDQVHELLEEYHLKSKELEEVLSNKEHTISNLEEKVHSHEKTISDLWEQLAGKDREIDAKKEELTKPDYEKETLKKKVLMQAKENEELRSRIADLETEYAKAKEHIHELEQAQERSPQTEQRSWNAEPGWGRSETIERGDRVW